MTQAEWDKEAKALNRAISRAEKAAKANTTLKEKIEALRKVKELKEGLRLHRLNRYSLFSE